MSDIAQELKKLLKSVARASMVGKKYTLEEDELLMGAARHRKLHRISEYIGISHKSAVQHNWKLVHKQRRTQYGKLQ